MSSSEKEREVIGTHGITLMLFTGVPNGSVCDGFGDGAAVSNVESGIDLKK